MMTTTAAPPIIGSDLTVTNTASGSYLGNTTSFVFRQTPTGVPMDWSIASTLREEYLKQLIKEAVMDMFAELLAKGE